MVVFGSSVLFIIHVWESIGGRPLFGHIGDTCVLWISRRRRRRRRRGDVSGARGRSTIHGALGNHLFVHLLSLFPLFVATDGWSGGRYRITIPFFKRRLTLGYLSKLLIYPSFTFCDINSNTSWQKVANFVSIAVASSLRKRRSHWQWPWKSAQNSIRFLKFILKMNILRKTVFFFSVKLRAGIVSIDWKMIDAILDI